MLIRLHIFGGADLCLTLECIHVPCLRTANHYYTPIALLRSYWTCSLERHPCIVSTDWSFLLVGHSFPTCICGFLTNNDRYCHTDCRPSDAAAHDYLLMIIYSHISVLEHSLTSLHFKFIFSPGLGVGKRVVIVICLCVTLLAVGNLTIAMLAV